jgi:hypothetical protein
MSCPTSRWDTASKVRGQVVKEEDMGTRSARRDGELLWVTTLVAITFVSSVSLAAPPWKKLIPFKSVEADTGQSYWLTEDQGPWLIFAASFNGMGAEQQAHDLVLELRRQFNMEAYLHKRHFDFSEPVYGRGVNRYGGPKRMRHRKAASFDEIAVLVGNYASPNAPGLEDDLDKIKYAKPKSLLAPGQTGRGTSQSFAVLRDLQRIVNKDPDRRRAGPMRRAFVARNPLLPKEFFTGVGLDPFVLKMNKNVKHSLLDCPGKFTVRVASFRGDSRFLSRQEEAEDETRRLIPRLPGLSEPTELEKAAINAHKLTELLRDDGIEAYEFHDRYESVVTIGSFDSVGNQMPDGKINLHPQVYKIMQTYGAQRGRLPGQAETLQPRTLEDIPFDLQPVPVQVPRRSIAADYAAGNHEIR